MIKDYHNNFTAPKIAMLLAAGLGTRLRPITDTIPKALVEVQGRPVLDWNIEHIIKAGIKRIIINTHYLAEQIVEYINKANYSVEINIIHEPVLLGTGGSVLNAMEKFGRSAMVVVNADALFWGGNPVKYILNAWQPEKMECLVLAHDKEKSRGKAGDFNIDGKGNILKLGTENKWIMAGCSIFTPEYFRGYEVGFFTTPEIFFQYSPKYFAIENPYNWCDIGTTTDLEFARKALCA